jgi:heme a synthase
MTDRVSPPCSPRWVHYLALLTVVAALPLVILGTQVTTNGWGLVDARGLRSPWYFLQEFAEKDLGWKVEHGHRQVGWIVGLCVIVLAAALWWREPRRGVRWLGLAALAAVCVQGALGIFRIELHALLGPHLAMIHGCFAQLVLTLLVCVAFVTSRSWMTLPGAGSRNLRAWSILLVCLVFAQLVVGGFVRHLDYALAGRVHLLLAFAVVAAALWSAKLAFEHEVGARAAKVLLALIAVQVFLGVESWLGKFASAASPWLMLEPLAVHAEWFRSLHYLTGTFILATSVIIMLRAQQALGHVAAVAPPARTLEEAL